MNNPKFHPYTPPNAPHTPLARKTTRLASRTSPRFDMVADSPIHNRTMLSLPQEANDQLPIAPLALNIIAPGTGTLQVTATASATAPRVPGPSPNRVKHSLQLLKSESHSIRLIIRAKEQEDKATPKTYERHYNCYEAW
ncbi:hypothetical protein B0H14DRAFT_2577866 [Mycena olivaceomarginata]|nr:hypothetical protein B0H14DRAFT_2577866 [Mycena olivaceomarginata]